MKVELSGNLKKKPSGEPVFGSVFSDHMLVCEYENGEWGEFCIRPYGDFTLSPATISFHYGQAIFEGLKAFSTESGEIRLFRPKLNFERLNRSAARLCMPELPVSETLDALKALLEIEKEWVPRKKGMSLYIRPTMMAVDKSLSVHSSKKYLFFIILSPVGAYYSGGLSPVRLIAEERFSRAAPGGTGEAKCAGNYAASLLSGEAASRAGYDQVLWLDAKEKKYVEEVGSMNIFFVLNGVAVTPRLSGSVLPGITRRTVLEYLISENIPCEERDISIDEVSSALESGALSECFGTGTAAVISPVGSIFYKGRKHTLPEGTGKLALKLYDVITGIQSGEREDKYGWIETISKK
jgi:branched-chain amino acid aminotransferase